MGPSPAAAKSSHVAGPQGAHHVPFVVMAADENATPSAPCGSRAAMLKQVEIQILRRGIELDNMALFV
jgi:hypothetical protein